MVRRSSGIYSFYCVSQVLITVVLRNTCSTLFMVAKDTSVLADRCMVALVAGPRKRGSRQPMQGARFGMSDRHIVATLVGVSHKMMAYLVGVL